MRQHAAMAAVTLVALAASASGCDLSKPCGAAMPVIQGAIIYADDAQEALNHIQLQFDSLPLDEVTKKKVDSLIAKAWEALRAAQKTLLAANDVCSKVDVTIIFSDFVQVWQSLKVLLAQTHPSEAAALGDPLIVVEAGKVRAK